MLKPITFERFFKSVNKYYQISQEDLNQEQTDNSGFNNEEAFIYVKENKKVIKIHLNEIVYIEGLSEYVQIYTENKKIITKTSMTNMEEKLPDSVILCVFTNRI